MTAETIAIQVPQPIYDRLERFAKLTSRPVESLVLQALSTSLPLLPEDLHPAQREALIALEELDDERLWQVERATFPADAYERFAELRDKQRADSLTAAEEAELLRLSDRADLLMLQKAYAAVLLRWRGQELPPLSTPEPVE